MSDRSKVINDLSKLGDYILDFPEDLQGVIIKSINHNAWFTQATIKQSLKAIAKNYLNRTALEKWLHNYPDNGFKESSIGLILAGNIPLVGFHDVLSVFVSGYKSQIKLSEKDKFLIPHLTDQLSLINSDYAPRFNFVERLENFQAVIATGSNSTGNYFEKYFSHVPHIIRKNRNAVAILFNDIDEAGLSKLGDDIFSYYGLGCRNVSKVYLENGFELDRLFRSLHKYSEVKMHNKYMNNYDYNNAMYLLNNESFLTNDFVLIKESEEISSRIATLHYSYFNDIDSLSEILRKQEKNIQCIVSDRSLGNFDIIPIGEAQSPCLNDFADGVDTMKFLSQLS